MTGSVKHFGSVAVVAVSLALAGCLSSGPSASDEERDPHFLRGKSLVSAMDYAGAIECFDKALQVNPQSAAAHYELALLYYQKELDPAAAIYHCQQYLKLRPGAQNSQTVSQVVLSCKQELARTVSLGPISEKQQRDLEKLAEEKQQLEDQNKRLTEELQKLRPLAGAPAPALAARPEAQRPEGRGTKMEADARHQSPVPPGALTGNPTTKETSNSKLQTSNRTADRGQWADTRGQQSGDRGQRSETRGQKAEDRAQRTQEYASSSGGTSSKTATIAQDTRRSQTSSTTVIAAAKPARAGSMPALVSSAARGRAYTIRAGDTAFIIAKRNGVKLGALVDANPGMDPRRLRPGQTLSIPTSEEQSVVRQDRAPAPASSETRLAYNR